MIHVALEIDPLSTPRALRFVWAFQAFSRGTSFFRFSRLVEKVERPERMDIDGFPTRHIERDDVEVTDKVSVDWANIESLDSLAAL